jgi:hypothetical protein
VINSASKLKCKRNLDLSEIDGLDEISGDEQLALVWCKLHRRWEWHWLPRDVADPRWVQT